MAKTGHRLREKAGFSVDAIRAGACSPGENLSMSQPIPSHSGQKERTLRALVVMECGMAMMTVSAAFFANSAALLTNAVRSLLDLLVCAVSLVTVRLVGRRHAHFDYGLGKLENLAVLFVVLAMGVALAPIVARSLSALFEPQPLDGTGPGLVALTAALIFNLVFYLRFKSLHARDNSPVMEGQMHLYRNATVATLCALSAVFIGSHAAPDSRWLLRLDPIASFLLAALVAQSAYQLARRSLLGLLDATVEDSLQHAINRELAKHIESYSALHGVRARHSGSRVRVEVFLDFEPDLSCRDLLARCKALKADLENAIPRAEVWIVPSDTPPSAL